MQSLHVGLCLSPVTTSPASGCVGPFPGLIAGWGGETNANDLLQRRDGILLNGTGFGEGKVQTAFLFDGVDDCVRIPFSPPFAPATFSVETWVKPTAQVRDRENQDLIFAQSFGAPQLVVRPGANGLLVRWQFYVNFYSFPGAESVREIFINEWSHLAGTWDGTTLKLYINGVLEAQNTPHERPTPSACDFFIGGFWNACNYTGQFFQGVIDEVALYDRALSAAEIRDIFNAGSAGKCQPPLLLEDGIPPNWRERFFGAQYRVDPRVTAVADPDQDGANNYQEYLAGTYPLDPNSVHRVPLFVTTFAGSVQGRQDGPLALATFTYPAGMAQDRQGRLYVTESYFPAFDVAGYGGQSIRLIDTNGMVSTWTGGAEPGLVDGPRQEARYRGPNHLVFDTAGNAFITDRYNHRIRKLDTNGIVSTFAGSTRGFRDGVGTNAQFRAPIGITIDRDNNLYVADWENYRVRKITPDGNVSTFAGSGAGAQDGPRSTATFNGPAYVSWRNDGSLFVADWGNGLVRKISPDGIVSTFASGLPYVEGVEVDAQGSVYAAVSALNTFVKYSAEGREMWRFTPQKGTEDGPVPFAKIGHFNTPFILANGDILLTEDGAHRVRLVKVGPPPLLGIAPAGRIFTNLIVVSMTTPVTNGVIRFALNQNVPVSEWRTFTNALTLTNTASVLAQVFVNGIAVSEVATETFTALDPGRGSVVVSTLAGSVNAGFRDDQGVLAQFRLPNGGFVGPDGLAYIADSSNHRVRRVNPANGVVSTIAGTGQAGFVDGAGTNAQFNLPLGVFVNPAGEIFVADAGNNRIRKISPEPPFNVTTIAGSGVEGYADGPANTARFNFPNDLVIDRAGNICVSEFNNHTIRKITPAREVSTFLGDGSPGFDDGPRKNARLNRPAGLAIDQSGSIYVTEWGSHRVRKIAPDEVVTTVAGSVFPGFLDASGSDARFTEPDGIAVDAVGNLYVTEHGNHAVRKITPEGRVTTVAGTGTAGFIDGEGRAAAFNAPGGIGLEANGNLIVVDTGNHSIRKVTVPRRAEFVQRDLPAFYIAGAGLAVTLKATPPRDAVAYAVEDSPPAGWVVGQIGPGGSYDASQGKVKFGPFFEALPRTFAYEVRPPPSATGRRQFSGTVALDGESGLVRGESEIDLAPLHPCDLNPADFRIAIEEVTAYGAAWRKGLRWPVDPNPIPIDFVTRAGTLWKNGEDYTFDPNFTNAPSWWSPSGSAAPLGAQKLSLRAVAVSVATRAWNGGFTRAEPLLMEISVVLKAGASVYAVEDQIPDHWSVGEISHDGTFDSVQRRVKWGPFFDNASRTFTYQASREPGTFDAGEFVGVVSLDGVSLLISGPKRVSGRITLCSFERISDGAFQLRIAGELDAEYAVEVSRDLSHWTPLTTATNSRGALLFTDPDFARQARRFYRLVGR